ncbi:hypothetical protein QJ854_gp456 [Moumouvirus goulette]|uniref:Uncharacterized protein n=1 Tax=Moumouvirus goulette TaxID=1247379 RepID=M1PMW9_9VIRU|nr:hypothetical protein QJ854_gp456 [Moumouvirus goulette]AGF85326.1 hypothetical protein glt_00517 [Moumouvirus goulette]
MENFCATNVLPFILSSDTNNFLNMFVLNENSSSRRNKSETPQKSNYIKCLEDHLKYQNEMYAYTYRGYTFNIYCPFRFNWIAEVKIPFNHVDYRVNELNLNHVYKVHGGIHRNFGSDYLIITTDGVQDYCLLRESYHGTNESKITYRDFEFVKNQAMYLIDQMCERQNLYLAGKRRTQYTRTVQPNVSRNIQDSDTLSIVDFISRLQGGNNNYLDTLNKITSLKPGQSVSFDLKFDDSDLSNATKEQLRSIPRKNIYNSQQQDSYYPSTEKYQNNKSDNPYCCEKDCVYCTDPYVTELEKEKTKKKNVVIDTDYLFDYFINEDKVNEKFKNENSENKESTNSNLDKYMDIFTNYFMENLNCPKKINTEEKSNENQNSINLINNLLNIINQSKPITNNVDYKNNSSDTNFDSTKKDTTVVTKDGVTISDYDEENYEDNNKYEFIPDYSSPANYSVYNSESKSDNEEEQPMLSNSSEDNNSEDNHSEDNHSEDNHSEDNHSEDNHSEDNHSEVSTDSEMPPLEDIEDVEDFPENYSENYSENAWTRPSWKEYNDANICSQ